jgi:DNA polymerase-1
VDVKWTCSEGQAYVLDERTYTTSLDFLCRQHFGLSVKEIDNLDRKNMENCRVEDVCRYNALDAKYHRLLSRIQEPQIIEQGLGDVYHHQIERTIAVVPTQLNGVPIDPKVNDELYDKYCDELDLIEDQLAEDPAIIKFKRLAGHDFRPSAHQDVRFLLTTVLRTADVANTNKKTLAKVKSNVIRLLEKWRKADKVISTYLLPVRKGSPHLYKGRIHPIISTTKTRTWRTASEDPNAQNWPKRTEGVVVRRQLRPGGDLRVVAFDFAGIQARNVAMESNDETLVESFWNRYDIHTDWMERINRKCPGWIPKGADKDKLKALRNVAKNGFVFPSFFGARAKKLSTELSIDIEDAEELRTEFFDLFHDIHLWHEELHRHYYEKGFVTGLSGFIRRAPITPNEMINAPIQADESLIVLEAMVDLSKLQDPRFQPALEIHDDLTFIWPKREIEKNTEVVIREMLRIRHDWINCPLAVERSIGEDWMSLKGAGEFFSDKLGYGPKR